MRDCFNRMEDSSNYSVSVLQTNVDKNTSSIAGRGAESQMLYVSRLSCILHYGDHYIRDNYNSLTSAKFPPKYDDGQLKFICVDKKADKINILTDKVISIIKTMAVLEEMITVYPRVVQ